MCFSKQKTAYEMLISDWSSDVCSSDLVDAGLFAQASDPATEVPGAIADIRHPVVGYHGSIHEWIDLPLIEWLATQRPDWTFLLVGHAAVDVSRLERLPNVVLAGAQPYASLPRWARAYDVAIIP